uniref:Uncharacterized protein n=1 Tax=Arundo donax TaxID=35708 RepID=A0A0A9DFS2_ARUDO
MGPSSEAHLNSYFLDTWTQIVQFLSFGCNIGMRSNFIFSS